LFSRLLVRRIDDHHRSASTNLEMDGSLVYDKFAPTAPATKFTVVRLRECVGGGTFSASE